MTPFDTFAVLLTVAAAFAYVNHRWIRFPMSIGLMALALAASSLLLVLDHSGLVTVTGVAKRFVEGIPLEQTLLHGALGVLLFAGALHFNLSDLHEERIAIIALAAGGTLISTFAIGGLAFLALPYVGVTLSFGYCLLFGALISPTDPIAVLGILKNARVPRSLELQISAESLFNDGVGLVVFTTVLGVVAGEAT